MYGESNVIIQRRKNEKDKAKEIKWDDKNKKDCFFKKESSLIKGSFIKSNN